MNTDINFKLQQSSLFRKCSFFVLCVAPLSLQALVPRNNNEFSEQDQQWASQLELEARHRERVLRLRREQRQAEREQQQRLAQQRAEQARIAEIGNLVARIAEEERAIVRNNLQFLPNAQTDPATIGVTISMLPGSTRHALLQEAVYRVHRQEGLRAINNRRRTRNEQADQNPGAPKRDRRR